MITKEQAIGLAQSYKLKNTGHWAVDAFTKEAHNAITKASERGLRSATVFQALWQRDTHWIESIEFGVASLTKTLLEMGYSVDVKRESQFEILIEIGW